MEKTVIMKKGIAVHTKHIFKKSFVYRLSYYVITEENKYGIMVTSEKFRCNDMIFKKSPTTTQIMSETVMLKASSFEDVLKKLEILSKNLVFPSQLKEILNEIT